MACLLGVFPRLDLTHQTSLTRHASQSKAVHVRVLAFAARLVGQLQRLRQNDIVRSGEDGLRRAVCPRHKHLQGVIVDAIVDEEHTFAVTSVLPKAVHADCLSVNHADLALVELRQDGELDGAAPRATKADPSTIFLVIFPQDRLRVGGGIAGYDVGDELAHVGRTGCVIHASLHHVINTGEQTGVVSGYSAPLQNWCAVQERGFRLGNFRLVLFFLYNQCVSWKRIQES